MVHLLRLLLCLFVSFATASCSITKYVPDDGYLLDRVCISGDIGSATSDDLYGYVRQQPNPRFLHLWRVGLGVYSLSGRSERRFNEWLRRVGSAPVVYDENVMHRSAEQLRLYLSSRGYYDAQVSDTMVVTADKRCEVEYRIRAGEVYRIASLGYSVPNDEVGRLIIADTVNSLLRVGHAFDSNVHDDERGRIVRLMQENGYYAFGKDYIYYVVDSSSATHLVRDSIVVLNALGGADRRTQVPHRKAIVDEVELLVIDPDDNVRSLTNDSVRLRISQLRQGLSVRYKDKNPFTERLLRNSCFIRPGEIYSLSDAELTQRRFNSLKPFRQASFRFFDTDSSYVVSDTDTLNHIHCVGFLQTKQMQGIGIDIEGTNSSGNLGAAANIRYTHANMFHGAEAFSVKWRLATQRQSATSDKEDFYTLETSIETSLSIPALLFPYSTQHFYMHHNPNTVFSASYDYQRRPEFTRSVVALRMNYNWHGSRYAQHSFTPIEFNVVNIPSISSEFNNYISGTYLQYSYTNHFIMSLGYAFLFNQQKVQRNSSGWYVRFSAETAGNILNALTPKTSDEDFKRVFGIRFAQYARFESELRYQVADFWDNNMVFRLFGGIGIPYGNSIMLPFEKSFFAGGANSLRAWPVRGLGPGSEAPDPSLRYHNQTSDMRFEANAEYRFKIFSVFEGALFADAGNIWALKRSHSTPQATISSNFYKQIALGAGLGLRLNFDYFIFRVDAAYKLRDPAATDTWVVRNRFRGSDIAWNFAIGYPF